MNALQLDLLIGKLAPSAHRALQEALGLTVARRHNVVDLEHLLIKLCDDPSEEAARVLAAARVDTAKLLQGLYKGLDRFKSDPRPATFSERVLQLISNGWLLASINYEAQTVHGGHLLLALVATPGLSSLIRESAPALAGLSTEAVRCALSTLKLQGSAGAVAPSAPAESAAPASPRATGQTPALDRFTFDLTERARGGQIDPVLCREDEIRQVIDILTRRRQNNPILTGEPGVGKTAVVEGLALRIATGDVPSALRSASIRVLDLALLQAGTGVRGEFEERLKSVLTEVKAAPQPIILFIDEAHTLIGAGGSAGQGDAANLLKPALARGELRTIAATTWAEYKEYFEKDAALARRFQVVRVLEPTDDRATVMVRGLTTSLEKHHKVRILDEAVSAAVKLSRRYLSERLLPDKAISVLSTACARVELSLEVTPAPIDDLRHALAELDQEGQTLSRELRAWTGNPDRCAEIAAKKESLRGELTQLEEQWAAEKDLAGEILSLHSKLADAPQSDAPTEDPVALREQLTKLRDKLSSLQGARPLMQPFVDRTVVAEIIASWTGIPLGRMLKEEVRGVLSLKETLARRIIGQNHALDAICERLITAKAGLEDPGRPIGVFLLVGPSGVGKTATALALAEAMYGGEQNLVTINMSEYQEAHTVSALRGSPVGYEGHGKGGILTEGVRRKPYSVVLLDEIEKAHPDVLEIFYQVFDKGVLSDADGREVDFKNTIVLLTSNVGSETSLDLFQAKKTAPAEVLAGLDPELKRAFQAAFLARMMIVPYSPIGDENMRSIIKLQLLRVRDRLQQNHRARFSYDDAVTDEIARSCTSVESGARNVDHIITRSLLPMIAREVLGRLANGGSIAQVHVKVSPNGGFDFQIS